MNQVGPIIRKLREEQGLTQEQLVARCNLQLWTISRGTLAKIESQVRRLTDIEVGLMAKALKVDVQVLFEGEAPTDQS